MGEALEKILASREELLRGLRALGEEFPERFQLLESATNFASLVMEDGEELFSYLGRQGTVIPLHRGPGAHHLRRPPGKPALLSQVRDYFQQKRK